MLHFVSILLSFTLNMQSEYVIPYIPTITPQEHLVSICKLSVHIIMWDLIAEVVNCKC